MKKIGWINQHLVRLKLSFSSITAPLNSGDSIGHDYIGKVEKHASQKDYSGGFGGKFGIQTDRVDKSAVGFDYKVEHILHESQTDHKKGFGGKFGIESDRMDKSAVGFQDVGKIGTAYSKTKPDIQGAKPSNLKYI